MGFPRSRPASRPRSHRPHPGRVADRRHRLPERVLEGGDAFRSSEARKLLARSLLERDEEDEKSNSKASHRSCSEVSAAHQGRAA